MKPPFFQNIRLDNFLSFEPGSPALELLPLNVVIGPNGAGKSNLLEGFELLHAAPTDLAAFLREGGGSTEWIWKGGTSSGPANVSVSTEPASRPRDTLGYGLSFRAGERRPKVVEEYLSYNRVPDRAGPGGMRWIYENKYGVHRIWSRVNGTFSERRLDEDDVSDRQSILAQIKDKSLYPELTGLARRFDDIQVFREYTFGRHSRVRLPQPADLPGDKLLPDCSNLALVLNQIEHRNHGQLERYLKRFLPRFERFSTLVQNGTVQFYLHEQGFGPPIPPTRLSDGTLRLLAMLACLFSPTPPSLLCIDEPELGLHPDAMSLIAELLVERAGEMQVLVTTHSDALVSALSEHAESIVTCERRGGGTVLTRIEADKIAFWLERYRLGEIWRLGEIGANP